MNKKKFLFPILCILFLIVSLLHVLYASFVQRGLYLDGSVHFIALLNSIAQGQYNIPADSNHTRFITSFLQTFPTLILGNIFGCTSKYLLSFTYSLTLFLTPLLLLFWNYRLTKRTKNKAIFFFALLEYCLITLLFEIFAVVETIIGVQIYFLILNYLFAKCAYSKLDKVGIVFLLIALFGIYEHTIIIGSLLFIGMFLALKEKPLSKVQVITKLGIGITSLCAALYTFLFVLFNSHEHSNLIVFLNESASIWTQWNKSCTILSVITIIFLTINTFKKKTDRAYQVFMILTYIYTLKYMFNNLQIYLCPVQDGHTRCIQIVSDCIIIFGFLCGKFFKIPEQKKLIQRCYIPVLLCGISLTIWQIVNSYYFDINLKYFKTELKNCQTTLFIPEEHEEISTFLNKKLRRYIWHENYSTTALAIADDYKIKTMPLHYKTEIEDGNIPLREYLYSYPNNNYETISLPYTVLILKKNKFWDISDYAEALGKYNRENNIKLEKENPYY